MKLSYIKIMIFAFVVVANCVQDAQGADASGCHAKFTSHVDERECLEKVFKLADVELNQAEHKLRNALKRWKEDKPFKERALSRFDKAAKSFRLYRHDACEFDASTTAGGNGASDLRLDCAIRLTNERFEIIKEQNERFSE